MTDPLDIPKGHNRLVWVFSIDLPKDQIPTFEAHGADGQWPLGQALGLTHLPDQSAVETFDVATLKDYGFARYLGEANGMDVSADADILDSLEGHVVLVFSKALAPDETRFDPSNALRLVGRYGTPPSIPSMKPLTADSSAGILAQGKPPKSRARMSGMIATLVLAFLALFVTILVLMS